MTLPHWRDGSWDRLRLGGKLIAGLADVSCDAENSIAHVSAKGVHGPRMKSEGYLGGKVTIKIRVWRKADLAVVESQLAFVHPANETELSEPVEIGHPNAAFCRIDYIAVKKISAPMPAEGMWTLSIDALQWYPPEEQKKSGGAGTPKPPSDGGPLDFSVPAPDPVNVGASFP